MAIPSSSMPRTGELLAQQRLQVIDRAVLAGTMKPEEVAQEKKDLQKRSGRKWRLNLWLLLGILLVAALLTALLRSLSEKNSLLWLFVMPSAPAQIVGDFALLFAPLLAIAIAIERLLETVFDWYEQSIRAVSEVVASLRQPVDWIENELKEAYQAAEEAAGKTGVQASKASLKALELAEERLSKAEKRLLSWTRAPEYVAWKRALSIWVGLLVGLEVAVLGDLGMLRTIGLPVPRLLDMLATGLVIGAGPGPMHSLIGILQSGKDALQKLGNLAEGKAVREAASLVKPGASDS